jgi:hypothetical protein
MHLLDFRQNSIDGGSPHRETSTYTGQNKYIPRGKFKHTIPVFERWKAVRAASGSFNFQKKNLLKNVEIYM